MASPLRGRNDEVEAQRRRWTFYEVINLGLGMGTAGRFAKGPAGIHAFSGETKMDSNKEGVRPPAPPGPLERPSLVVSRRAPLSLALPRLRNPRLPLFFEK